MSNGTEQEEDFVVGAQDREPEVDLSGLYLARLGNLSIYNKTDDDIEKEALRWGKDPAKIDKRQYIWIFDIPDLEFSEREWRVYTGTFFGEKAKASDIAAALIGHRPAKNEEIRKSQLVEKPCQVLIEYDPEKGRNKIAKVMPPKRSAMALEAKSDGVEPEVNTSTYKATAAAKAQRNVETSEPGNVAPLDDGGWEALAAAAKAPSN